ncbi:MAG: HAD family phosphatase [Pseudomonadota bacterium]
MRRCGIARLHDLGDKLPRPHAYLFDMDGLLLDTERLFLETGLPLLQEIGMSAAQARAFFCSLVGTSSVETSARLREVAGPRAAALEAAWRTATGARIERDGIALRPTVGETLSALSGQGARMAVVTSTHEAASRHHLQRAGLADHFELVVAGDAGVANKPDPAPYLHAAQSLGVDPADCAAFEDSDPGIASAVRPGCMAFQIPDLRPAGLSPPALGQRIATTLAEAVALLHA